MESPFEKALREVTRGFEDGDPSSPPSWSTLNFLLGNLSHQESKIKAINANLALALLQLYNIYSELAPNGTAWTDYDLALYATCPAYLEYSTPATALHGTSSNANNADADATNDVTYPARAECVRLLLSLANFADGRAAIHAAAGFPGALSLFADPSACVRYFAAELLHALTDASEIAPALTCADDSADADSAAADSTAASAEGSGDTAAIAPTAVASTLYTALAADPDARVVAKVVAVAAALAAHCAYAPATAVDTVISLLTSYSAPFITATVNANSASDAAAAAASAGLSRLELRSATTAALDWLVRLAGSSEPLRLRLVSAGAVAAAAPLLSSPVYEHQRLAAAAVHSLTATCDAAGRAAALAQPGLLQALATIALDLASPQALRKNAVLALRSCALLPAAAAEAAALLVGDARVSREVLGSAVSAKQAAVTLRQHKKALFAAAAAGPSKQTGGDGGSGGGGNALGEMAAALGVIESVLKGPQGGDEVWAVVGIVDLLDELSRNANVGGGGSGSTSGAAPVSREAMTVSLLASKCISLLCQESRDARGYLDRLREKQAKDATAAAREGRVAHPTIMPEGLWPQ